MDRPNVEILPRPISQEEYGILRPFIQAHIGNPAAQLLLAQRYLKNSYKFRQDAVEALKWFLVLEKQNMAMLYNWSPLQNRQQIQELESQMNQEQIQEARRRAGETLFIHNRSTYLRKMDSKENFPTYQYELQDIQ
jgi:hypothetical protein